MELDINKKEVFYLKKIFMILICAFAFLMITFGLIGCGGGVGPSKRTYTMEIHITGQSGQAAIQKITQKLQMTSIQKDPSWWVDQPENGFFTTIGRSSGNTLNGMVEATAILKDNLGNTVIPSGSLVHWNSIDNPIWSATGNTCYFMSDTQGKYILHATYEGNVYINQNQSNETTYVSLAADAITIFVYRNSTSYGTQTDYFNMSSIQCLPNATGAEIYHTNEGGINYINCPYGMAFILDPETDPITSEINWFITGDIKKVPDGLSFTDTKLPLVEYGTYIVRLSGGGYARAQAAMGGIPYIMRILFSTSPTTDFPANFGN